MTAKVAEVSADMAAAICAEEGEPGHSKVEDGSITKSYKGFRVLLFSPPPPLLACGGGARRGKPRRPIFEMIFAVFRGNSGE
jgi:hypothetical protein